MEIKNLSKEVIDLIQEFVNEETDNSVDVNEDTKLFGANGIMDSMSLVSLIVEIEDFIDENYDVRLTLANEKAFSRRTSPFVRVNYLIDYIVELIKENKI